MKSIYFKQPHADTMVRGILDGVKTAHRMPLADREVAKILDEHNLPKCPLGAVGDTLIVKEAFNMASRHIDGIERKEIWFRENPRVGARFPGIIRPTDRMRYLDASTELDHHCHGYPDKWLPPMRMPVWASRATLVIQKITLERLHSVTSQSALQEAVGVLWYPEQILGTPEDVLNQYIAYWNETYGENAWEFNPWTWAVEFEGVELWSH